MLGVILTTIFYLGALIASFVLTAKSTKLRKQYFREVFIFTGAPLFFLISGYFTMWSPSKPISVLPPDATVGQVRDELVSLEDRVQFYIEAQQIQFTLYIVFVFISSMIPLAFFSYRTMQRLEKSGADENDKIF